MADNDATRMCVCAALPAIMAEALLETGRDMACSIVDTTLPWTDQGILDAACSARQLKRRCVALFHSGDIHLAAYVIPGETSISVVPYLHALYEQPHQSTFSRIINVPRYQVKIDGPALLDLGEPMCAKCPVSNPLRMAHFAFLMALYGPDKMAQCTPVQDLAALVEQIARFSSTFKECMEN